jgi:hypothetical protein
MCRMKRLSRKVEKVEERAMDERPGQTVGTVWTGNTAFFAPFRSFPRSFLSGGKCVDLGHFTQFLLSTRCEKARLRYHLTVAPPLTAAILGHSCRHLASGTVMESALCEMRLSHGITAEAHTLNTLSPAYCIFILAGVSRSWRDERRPSIASGK